MSNNNNDNDNNDNEQQQQQQRTTSTTSNNNNDNNDNNNVDGNNRITLNVFINRYKNISIVRSGGRKPSEARAPSLYRAGRKQHSQWEMQR
jgi:hypothetical protein